MVTASIGDSKNGPFILNCNYCMWNTLDVGIKFDKATGIRTQLYDLAVARGELPKQIQAHRPSDDPLIKSSLSQPPFTASDQPSETPAKQEGPTKQLPDPAIRYHALKQFYKDQIAESSSMDPGFSTSALDMAFSSPSSVQRIMNLYINKENSIKRAQQKVTIMREAQTASEGLALSESQSTSSFLPDYAATATLSQRDYQTPSFLGHPDASALTDLRPMPTLMRSKRSKRCAMCKHILTRPEVKVSSARYRIKLIALAYIPFVTIKPLPISGGLPPPGPDGSDIVLSAGKPIQFIMTLRNPLFENVNVSLGSPSVTPGKHGHRVTILCPQFQIGKNSDAWDDALNNPPNRGMVNPAGGEQIAGKLYDQGRNWASVILEIIPASIVRMQDEQLEEDEDVIEVPIRVRLEWQVTDEETGIERRRRDKRLDEEDADDGKRELSYWMVVGIGRVSC
jgi:dynactin-4